jgi:hypothetical protein
MKFPKWEVLLVCLAAIALLFADRWVRLSMILNQGFENYTQRCGLDMEPCPNGTVCANGYCISTSTPKLSGPGLPVYP